MSQLAHVRDIQSQEKIENNLIISNWKIISNCCLPAFFREVLVNYASNMILIRLNNCTIKQQEFLHGLNNLQNLVSVGETGRFIFSLFANQNFSRDRQTELLCKWISLVLHGLPIKSKHPSLRKQIALSLSSQLIVLLFLWNSHLQGDI